MRYRRGTLRQLNISHRAEAVCLYKRWGKVYVHKGVQWHRANSHFHWERGHYLECLGSLQREASTR